MRHIEFLTNASTLKTDRSTLPIEKQILINLDRNEIGEIIKISVNNSFTCDMTEFPKAIKFVGELHLHFALNQHGWRYQLEIHDALWQLEIERNKINGRPFLPQP